MIGRHTAVACILCWWMGCGSESLAQETAGRTGERDGSIPGLPSWLRLGAELQGRAEFNLDSEQDLDERLYLNRLRLRATVQPARWMGFFIEGQDARAFRFNRGPGPEGLRDTFDIRQGYINLGNSERGFQARVGRQELSFGNERLVAADNYWDPFGHAFDAVRLAFARERLRVEAFTGFRVEPDRRRPDRWDKKNRLSGISAQFQTGAGGGVIEPYLFWKRGGDALDLLEQPGHRDVATPGLRAVGNLPRGLDYNLEVALQRGHVVKDRISAWSGHWEFGWKPLGKDLGPRLGFEYNYASGDADPRDGRHQTFDDLYPARFNAYGINDPFVWRNIEYPAITAELPLARRWTLRGGWGCYWLATVQDGYYAGGDAYLVRNPRAASSHLGNQVFLSGAYAPSDWWRMDAGYRHLFPGAYLRQSNCPLAANTVYLLSSFTF